MVSTRASRHVMDLKSLVFTTRLHRQSTIRTANSVFQRSCLGSLLTQGLSCALANERRCKGKYIKFKFKNKPCDKLKSVTKTVSERSFKCL